MKFNVLVVAAMVITSVNASGKERFLGRLGKIVGALQEPDPNETEPTCDDLEAKLRHLYDNIRARNAIVCYGAPELYKIMEGHMGSRVGNGKEWRRDRGGPEKRWERGQKVNIYESRRLA
ncbi:hypothetical protein BASA62_009725 [Batrachochytrium salamandrivorans]|nr:hypothetical protein BASA62_009725 [Batrachochytrium salamandrivorans]